MMRALVVAAATLPWLGCASPARRAPPPDTPQTPKGAVVWRLAERTPRSLDAPWADALDGAIPADANLLVYERVSPSEPARRDGREGLVRVESACGHDVRVTLVGPAVRRVGEPVELELAVDGRDHGHVVRIEGTTPAVRVLDVRGAEPLAGYARTYVVAAGAAVRVRFTSDATGRAGLGVSVEREVRLSPEGGGRLPPSRR